MRKIIVLTFLSLDGVMQAPGGPDEDTTSNFQYGGWTFPYFDEFAGKIMDQQMSGEYDLLLGRKTYDIFADYWPQHTEGWPQVNQITKYVVSNNNLHPTWENSVVIKDITQLKKLKGEGELDLQVHGSGELIQSLLKHDLVDELWLKTFPVILGKGKRLFTKDIPATALTLLSSQVSPTGVIFANYQRAGEVKTGSF